MALGQEPGISARANRSAASISAALASALSTEPTLSTGTLADGAQQWCANGQWLAKP
jgi:hypothetical protein